MHSERKKLQGFQICPIQLSTISRSGDTLDWSWVIFFWCSKNELPWRRVQNRLPFEDQTTYGPSCPPFRSHECLKNSENSPPNKNFGVKETLFGQYLRRSRPLIIWSRDVAHQYLKKGAKSRVLNRFWISLRRLLWKSVTNPKMSSWTRYDVLPTFQGHQSASFD